MNFFFAFLLAQYADSSLYGYADGGELTLSDATMLGLLLIGLCALLSMAVHFKMQHSVRVFEATPAPLTGAQTAQRMLAENGLEDVRVTCVSGRLTDHYNPLDRTVNLSESVYHNASIAAMAVAAHECGHAVQHAHAYPWLGMRSSMVPLVNIGATFGQWVLFAGFIMLGVSHNPTLAWVGVAMFALSTLFAFVTLPVEFDASRRALAWLGRSELMNYVSQGQARTALRWAAMTYVAAALSSLAMLVYYALRILALSRRDD